MFSRLYRNKSSLSNCLSKAFATTAVKRVPGNLYTWGSSSSGIGYDFPKTVQKITTPTLIDTFSNNVVRVSMGNNHTAVVTAEGDLYTFGSGQYGALGHNDGDASHVKPKAVEFFKKHNLKVRDVAVGDHHTLALTDDGDVFSWGYGGKATGFITSLFAASFGALGHGETNDRYIPTPIEALRALPPAISVAAGAYFSHALNSEHDLYSWGRGEYAVFGDGSNKNHKLPIINEIFSSMKTEDKILITKVKSCGYQNLALASNGTLYGWGSNEHGQLGVKTEIGIEMYETANFPTKVAGDKIQGKKIVDFDLAEDIAILLADTNEVYWMGRKLAYEPTLLKLPEGKKIKKVAASQGSVCAITEDNEVYMKNKFMKEQSENLETGVFLADVSAFAGGEIITAGGPYKNRYAIVKA